MTNLITRVIRKLTPKAPAIKMNKDPLCADVISLLSHIRLDFGGGCSSSKAYVMAYLIRELKMKTSLDIGVYRGRSLMPQALSHLKYTGGKAYGVDPWAKEEAKESDNIELKDHIDNFVETTDFDAIYNDVDKLRGSLGVENNCTLIRKTSASAALYFKEQGIMFDLIHIDGNHDTAMVLKDVEDYIPLLNPNGILVMDDVSWDSVKPACDRVVSKMQKLFERVDAFNDYAVYRNVSRPDSSPEWYKLFKDDFVVRG